MPSHNILVISEVTHDMLHICNKFSPVIYSSSITIVCYYILCDKLLIFLKKTKSSLKWSTYTIAARTMTTINWVMYCEANNTIVSSSTEDCTIPLFKEPVFVGEDSNRSKDSEVDWDRQKPHQGFSASAELLW